MQVVDGVLVYRIYVVSKYHTYTRARELQILPQVLSNLNTTTFNQSRRIL